MKLLVLGGTAFIGPWVVRNLAAAGHQVTVFHRGKTPASLPPGVQTLRGDRQAMQHHTAELRALQPDVVIDMIAFNRTDAADVVSVFEGHAGRVVVASSCDVYAAFGGLIGLEEPAPPTGMLDEDAPLRSRRYPFRSQAKTTEDFMYSYDKLDVEETFAAAERLPATFARLPMVYGEGDRQRRLAGYLKQLRETGTITLGVSHARWATTRGYVRNMGAAVALLATRPESAGKTYNLADSATLTEEAFARAVASAAGGGDVRIVPDAEVPAPLRFPGDVRYHLTIDSSRLRNQLGYSDPVSLAEGIAHTVEWERNQTD